MASRFFSGSKPSRSKTRPDPPPERTSALPKRSSSIPTVSSSSTSTTTKTSKLPAPQTSSIPRTRTATKATVVPETQKLTQKSIQKSALRSAPTPVAKTEVKVETVSRKASLKDQQTASVSIPRGIGAGMGTHTEISSSNPLPQRNRLRRKQSSVDQRSRYAQSESSDTTHEPVSHHTASDNASPGSYTDPFPGSILGISMPLPNSASSSQPQRQTTPTEFATSNSRIASYALRQPHKLSTTDLPPPTPNFAARSSGSSSRYSESPGPFSRTSTPTSASSQSPGMLQAPKFAPARPRTGSPTRSRPPVTRRKFPGGEDANEQRGLSALRESQTSSSSSSTVKGVDIEQTENGRIARRVDTKTPPTPPLRLSSKRAKTPPTLASSSSTASDTEQALEQAPERVKKTNSKPEPTSRLVRPSQIATIPSTSSSNQAISKLPAPGGLPRPKMPPTRPSRENVPPLLSGEPGVIVKSNLAHLATTGHKRKDSAEKNVLGSPLKTEENSKKATRNLSNSSTTAPKRASITSPHLFPSEQKKETPPLRTDIKTPRSEVITPASASPSKSSSRFGLFSRRLKSPSETSTASPEKKQDKPEKLVKKGPAAGTGHEGYGKYARHGRSGSTSTAASRGRSSSRDRHSQTFARPSSSRKSSFGSNLEKPQLDDFYRDRLEPVVIGGGGEIKENRNSQPSLYQTPSGQTSQASVDTSSYVTSRSRATQETSAATSSVASSQRVSRELLPAPVLTTAPLQLPEGRTLAHRRSLRMFGDNEQPKIPPPINTKVLAPSPALDTYDSTLSSAPRTDDTQDVSEGHEGNWLRSKKRKNPEKGKLTRRLNFFNPLRSRSPERPSVELQRYQSNDSNTNTDIESHQEPRREAYYTMMDDVEPESGEVDLEERLRNIEGQLDFDQSVNSNALRVERDSRQMSMLLPSPPKFPSHFDSSNRPASPKVLLNQSPPKATKSEELVPVAEPKLSTSAPLPVRRPSRLQPTGRIPKVISKRDRLHNPSQQSFSRPFHRPSIDESSGSRSAIERPTLNLKTDLSPPETWNPFAKPASAPPANNALYGTSQEEEFLRFSPRKDSDLSASGSSGFMSLAPMTATTPAPHQSLSEDDVWDEYDQLLEDVGNGLPSLDTPEIESMIASFPSLTSLRSPPPPAKHDSDIIASNRSSDTSREHFTLASKVSSGPSQSGIPRAPRTSVPREAGPVTISSAHANDSQTTVTAKPATRHSVTSIESGSRYSTQSLPSRADSQSGSRSSVESERTRRVTQVMAEKTQSQHSHSLRFSALMTSRWLSFDRVLFSPAQEEILVANPQQVQSRVLVLDGLQNDDWAAYCALTYPGAVVYNLASFSEARKSNDTANSATWSPPQNLRKISHSSIAAPFPFPKGFFAAVVFRFPAASPPSAYKNAISECKRVLRPGGYLELTVLDMDLVNAGPEARRAVRKVKERIARESPQTSLSPASDTLMKYLGRRGFENVNRCTVGVPVAGAVRGMLGIQPGFEGASASATAAGNTTGIAAGKSYASASGNTSASGTATTSTASTDPSGPDPSSSSLTRLLSGQAGSTPNDMPREFAGPNMVARVGRWWWSRCYEKGVFGERTLSMWDNKLLVKECEKRETGLRLLVCYAQKPESPRRRTVSV